ncbi:MAG: hypothetical protein KA155_10275 [Alphaproteobacteria bacterium]|jgi:hypothetical protein|nr:hypothetical protein [Alphaproteobacteria bacterium]
MAGQRQISRQRNGGGGGSPPEYSSYKALSLSSDVITWGDFESTLKWLGYIKYEGAIPPRDELPRAVTWKNEDTNDFLYISAPRFDDHKAIQRYREALNVLLKRTPNDHGAEVRRGIDGIKISVHFKSKSKPEAAGEDYDQRQPTISSSLLNSPSVS